MPVDTSTDAEEKRETDLALLDTKVRYHLATIYMYAIALITKLYVVPSDYSMSH